MYGINLRHIISISEDVQYKLEVNHQVLVQGILHS